MFGVLTLQALVARTIYGDQIMQMQEVVPAVRDGLVPFGVAKNALSMVQYTLAFMEYARIMGYDTLEGSSEFQIPKREVDMVARELIPRYKDETKHSGYRLYRDIDIRTIRSFISNHCYRYCLYCLSKFGSVAFCVKPFPVGAWTLASEHSIHVSKEVQLEWIDRFVSGRLCASCWTHFIGSVVNNSPTSEFVFCAYGKDSHNKYLKSILKDFHSDMMDYEMFMDDTGNMVEAKPHHSSLDRRNSEYNMSAFDGTFRFFDTLYKGFRHRLRCGIGSPGFEFRYAPRRKALFMSKSRLKARYCDYIWETFEDIGEQYMDATRERYKRSTKRQRKK